ncbi:rhamnogalacturonan lyase [Botryobacter ruber]|uniref:rhamnogalacturonan lyase n=1 Tax=Botryobacter ruber TaxID=2171629 RepID=UPI000E0BEA81|nr:rhamnogalacturonan lyase [Botryobacter ruber]
MRRRLLNLCLSLALLLSGIVQAQAQKQMENLGRGVVAVPEGNGKVFVGWRMLGTDPDDIAFNLYRSTAGGKATKLNKKPLTQSTSYQDQGVDLAKQNAYFVKPVVKGKEQAASASFTLKANAPVQPFLSIPLQTLEGHTPNDAAVADLDGDGEYEIVLKQEMRPRDNSHRGLTGTTKLEAYKLDGTMLWRVDLGPNIREGAHYTPFVVYDFDGDGKAEVAIRTAEGTVDGTGTAIGDTDGDGRTDYRNMQTGYILEGPEFLSVFDGMTGKEVARTNYIPRGNICDYGDCYGNRGDRFLMAVAYLDGEHPSIIMCRGYYALTKLEAVNFRNGKLSEVWKFSSADFPGFGGQGNHNLSVADVDGDGKDEIIYGQMTLDNDGKGLYTTRIGHGDALHVSDLDPERPGLEVFGIQERFGDAGANFRDARTGEIIWKKASVKAGDDGEGPGRGLALDIDPRYPGYECWVAGAGIRGMFDSKGNVIADRTPACNMGIFWDGDVLSEILNGTNVEKWDYQNSKTDRLLNASEFNCVRNNGTKSNPAISADILGDWREEVIYRTTDNKELRIFTTTIPTEHRFYTFMHDPVYRMGIVWQNVGYNQPPHTSFYLGHGMKKPPRPNIVLVPNKLKADIGISKR